MSEKLTTFLGQYKSWRFLLSEWEISATKVQHTDNVFAANMSNYIAIMLNRMTIPFVYVPSYDY